MSKVVSIRLKPEVWKRLEAMARRLGRRPGETSALLIDEALRCAEFAFIQFRDSAAGRQAYVVGTSLAVWEVVFLLRYFDGDPERLARHLGWPVAKVKAALNYAEAYPEEIQAAIADNERGPEILRRTIPDLDRVIVDEP